MAPELKTFLIAMSPIVELRGAIPIALSVYKLSVFSAYIFSVLGNLIPLNLIILVGNPVSKFLSSKSSLFERFFSWLFLHTRKSQNSKVAVFGKELAVLIMVATPIPLIGGWSGAIAAFVLGIPFRRALPLVVLGTAVSGAIVTFVTLGLVSIIK